MNSQILLLPILEYTIDLHVKLSTKLDELDDDFKTISINVFPNPASDIISLKIDNKSNSNDLEVYLFNQLGDLIRKSVFERNNLLELNISNLNKGVYFIQVKDRNNDNFSKTEKVIVK